MPEDHKFKRISTDDDAEKAAEAEEVTKQGRISEFKWSDVEEAEAEGKLLAVSQDSIQECCTILADHLLSVISGEHFSELDSAGMKFVIPVDPGMHVLLRNRFEEEWDLDSRLDMFMEVREGLAFEFAEDSEKRANLDAKIQEALPATHRKKLNAAEVSLEDDAMVVDGESDMISIEISLVFAANT